MLASLYHTPWFDSFDQLAHPPSLILKSWLIDRQSTTARLQKGGHHFTINLIQQGHRTDSWPLQPIPLSSPIWHRQIIETVDHCPWLFATTIVSSTLLDHPVGQSIAHLKTQPLGPILFKDLALQRQACWFAMLTPQHPAFADVLTHTPLTAPILYQRCSWFPHPSGVVVLYETFLPHPMMDNLD